MSFDDDIATISAIPAVPVILDVVCRTTGMGFAAVARVTEDRWITCASRDDLKFGLKPGDELKVETTICHEVRQARQEVVIDEVASDALYCNHHTPAMYGFQSYVSVPINLADGSFFGTLCAIDPKPRVLRGSDAVLMFRLFADLIAFHIDAHRRYMTSETALSDAQRRFEHSEAELFDEQRTAALREQFIAVLGHDLRNPLAAISGGVGRLSRKLKDDSEATELVGLVQTTIRRMARLIDNVLDFARGRLGGGLTLQPTTRPIGPLLDQLASELHESHPDRELLVTNELAGDVAIDHVRFAQMLNNILVNALTYGAADSPVHLHAAQRGADMEVSVSNRGAPIPQEVVPSLFQPFRRGDDTGYSQGLGLGLYIASEIARAHGGRLDVVSDASETRFTYRGPLR